MPNVGKSTLINRLRNFHLKQGKKNKPACLLLEYDVMIGFDTKQKIGNAVKSGADPGITRNVQSKVKINHSPLVYMFDTPGILEPTFDDIETGFKLACLSMSNSGSCFNYASISFSFFCCFLHLTLSHLDCVKNHAVNANILADYILYKMNKSGNFK